ncbi:membrane protein of unknown function [Rhodovastum atsumiense]|nr:acyltransferase [Rhodovastum atsumiense]CAH2604768.1 membrane protein of unknown function [Rhodovastum atsumiense]
MKQIPDLTACRALFAGWVFAYHVNLQAHFDPLLGPLGGVVRSGAMGVDGFFILSGMILAYAHPDLGPTLQRAGAFWVKRLVRIYPLHLLMITLMAAMLGSAWMVGLQPREPGRFGPDELLSHLLLVQAWGFSDRWAWNYPSWSISAEWAGYLVFPLLLPLLRPARGAMLAGLIAACLAALGAAQLYAISAGLSLTYDGGLLRFFPEFIAGVLALRWTQAPRWPLPGHVVAWTGGAIVLGGALVHSELVTVAGLFLALAGMMRTNLQGRPGLLGRIPGMVWLGEISYAYYMSFALIETLQATLWRGLGLDPAGHKLLYGLGMTVPTLVLAALAWALVERPAMRAHAAWRRRRHAGVSVAPVLQGSPQEQ